MSEKTNVDLAAGGVAFKLRYDMPVNVKEVEQQQPEHLREYFRERLEHYKSMRLPKLQIDKPA